MIDLGLGIALGSFALQAFGAVSGFSRDNKIDDILSTLKSIDYTLEKLSNDIFLVNTNEYLLPFKNPQQYATKSNKDDIIQMYDPIQKSLGENIIVTDISKTPLVLSKAMQSNPWDILLDIRPLNRSKNIFIDNQIPITFFENDIPYTGWIQRRLLPIFTENNIDILSKQKFNTKNDPINFDNLFRQLVVSSNLVWEEIEYTPMSAIPEVFTTPIKSRFVVSGFANFGH